jgi:hypothetical protein
MPQALNKPKTGQFVGKDCLSPLASMQPYSNVKATGTEVFWRENMGLEIDECNEAHDSLQEGSVQLGTVFDCWQDMLLPCDARFLIAEGPLL